MFEYTVNPCYASLYLYPSAILPVYIWYILAQFLYHFVLRSRNLIFSLSSCRSSASKVHTIIGAA